MTRLSMNFEAFTSATLGILRLGGVSHEFFQAIAHLWVGYLIYGALWASDTEPELTKWDRKWYWSLVIILSILEVAAFLYYGKK